MSLVPLRAVPEKAVAVSFVKRNRYVRHTVVKVSQADGPAGISWYRCPRLTIVGRAAVRACILPP